MLSVQSDGIKIKRLSLSKKHLGAVLIAVVLPLSYYSALFLMKCGPYETLVPSFRETDGEHSNQPESKEYWMGMAERAWEYFQPGKGVNPTTGLHSAGLYWPYFTEWDLGTYIQAIIDASELGILQKGGQWGFDYRIEKILDFLKTRKLTSDSIPYLVYDSRTGEPNGDTPSFHVDEGKLIMALYNLKCLRPDLAQDIDYIVKVRPDNTQLIPDPESRAGSTDYYDYYVACAFKAFGFEGWDVVPSSIIEAIISQPNVTTYGVKLPAAHICTEPLLLTMFEVSPQDSRLAWLLSQVYLASEARYNATGHYTAFSEGNTGLDDPGYVYEFVVDWDGSTWKVVPDITPIAYLKVAVSFHAIFNTGYTKSMVEYIEGTLPASFSGFQDGIAEDGRIVNTIIDRTNGLIIGAARYAISNSPSPTPSPTPSLTPYSTPVTTPTPTPSPSPSLTPTVTPTPIPSSSPSFSPSPSLSPTSSPSPSSSLSPEPTTSPSPSLSASPSPSPSSNPSPSPNPSPSSSPSPNTTPSFSPSPSPGPSASLSPTTAPHEGWLTEAIIIVLLAVTGCLFLFLLLMIRLKRNNKAREATLRQS